MKKLTVEDIEQRLIDDDRPITLLSYGGGFMVKKGSRWKCHDCGNEWDSTANNILNSKRGCPPCSTERGANKIRFTEEDAKQRLVDDNRPITLLSYGKNYLDSSSLWKCHDCGNEWNISANGIFNSKSGCPPCGISYSLTAEIITQRLIDSNRSISLVDYAGSTYRKTTKWKCNDCGHEWCATVNSVLAAGKPRGCPPCGVAKRVKGRTSSKEYVEKQISERQLKVTMLYYGGSAHNNTSRWKCHDCGHEWNSTANNIIHTKRGCPPCGGNGFDSTKPAHFYLHMFEGFIKVGITNNLDRRHAQLNNQTINDITYTIEETTAWHFEDGKEAADLEAIVLNDNKKHSYTGLMGTSFDGRTELLEHDAHQGILDYIAEHYING